MYVYMYVCMYVACILSKHIPTSNFDFPFLLDFVYLPKFIHSSKYIISMCSIVINFTNIDGVKLVRAMCFILCIHVRILFSLVYINLP